MTKELKEKEKTRNKAKGKRGGKRWKRILLGSLAVLLLLLVLVPLLALLYTDFVVDMWWHESLGYGFYFWQRLLYRFVVFFVATLVFFLFFYLNFRIAARFLHPNAKTRVGERPDSKAERLLKLLRTGSASVYLPLSLLLALILARPLYSQWETTLLFLAAPAAGSVDPLYGKDISYYLFSLPVYQSLLTETFIALLVMLAALSVLYFLEARTQAHNNQLFPRGARVHLAIVVLMIFLVGVGGLFLERHLLVYVDQHMPLFFGPGFAQITVILPLIWASIVSLVALAVAVQVYLLARRGFRVVIGLGVLFLAILGLRTVPGIAQAVQDYIVEPDEQARETPYMVNNIRATLAAYDLEGVETRPYRFPQVQRDLSEPDQEIRLRNIPVWDRDVLLKVYRELQEIRTYYNFLSVDIDRYVIDDLYQQVFLAARELGFENLPQDSKTWINRWFKFTHGYGAVMSPAAQVGEEPKDWFLRDIPPRSDHGLEIATPGIYYGLEQLNPVIAPNRLGEIAYPGDTGVVEEDYRGSGGINIFDPLSRAVFAIYYRDYRIFFSGAIRPDSRMLIRRNIHESMTRLTPFFLLDRDPYIVVTNDRIYWIQDAYTWSGRYPNVHTETFGYEYYDGHMRSPREATVNYIRNSVKIVIDAYDGTMDYYIAEPDDPIVRGFSRIYPGLLKPLDEFPEALRPHLRYPKDLFTLQMQVYSKYHQTEPAVFYGQEDRWMFPHIEREDGVVDVLPYFLTLNLINPHRFEHLLLVPLNPKGKENMRAIAVAGSDGDNYGRIIVYSFPTGMLIHGISQVEAIINQDSAISQQFTLWSQGGADVARGNLILLLLDGVLTYVQPVYLKASGDVQIPELKRVIVSQGGLVAMEPSLDEAFEALRQRVQTWR